MAQRLGAALGAFRAANHWVQLALITPVMFYTGWPIHRTGWLALAHRSADMNSLITLGTVAAYGYSLLVTVAPGSAARRRAGGLLRSRRGDPHPDHARPADWKPEPRPAPAKPSAPCSACRPAPPASSRDGAEIEIPVDEVVVGDEILSARARRSRSTPPSWRVSPRWTSPWSPANDAGDQTRRRHRHRRAPSTPTGSLRVRGGQGGRGHHAGPDHPHGAAGAGAPRPRSSGWPTGLGATSCRS